VLCLLSRRNTFGEDHLRVVDLEIGVYSLGEMMDELECQERLGLTRGGTLFCIAHVLAVGICLLNHFSLSSRK